MKNIFIIVLLVGGLIFYVSNKDSTPDTLYFSGEQYKLGDASGKQGMAKTYQYTKSGRINGINDFVHVFVVDKTTDYIDPIRGFLEESYSLNLLDELDGKFGVFNTSGEQRDYYAYSVEQETATSYWILTFVNQSNFDNNKVSLGEARNKAPDYFRSLVATFNEISH
ncbi:hypothetical protein ACU6U9_19025 [Pseudomonas sp. HK3]